MGNREPFLRLLPTERLDIDDKDLYLEEYA